MEYFESSTVVVPFDFSDPSQSALEYAVDLVDGNSQIHLIHVVESSLMASMDMASPVPPMMDQEQQAIMLEKMQTLCKGEQFERVTPHCLIGDPGYEITRLAEEVEATLILMPSHGRRGLDRLLLGSVAERVLRLSHCPVLILRGDTTNYRSNKEATV